VQLDSLRGLNGPTNRIWRGLGFISCPEDPLQVHEDFHGRCFAPFWLGCVWIRSRRWSALPCLVAAMLLLRGRGLSAYARMAGHMIIGMLVYQHE